MGFAALDRSSARSTWVTRHRREIYEDEGDEEHEEDEERDDEPPVVREPEPDE